MDEIEMERIVQNYFKYLFSTKGISDRNHISDYMNRMPATRYTVEEVYLALKGMGPIKTLGADDYPTLFF